MADGFIKDLIVYRLERAKECIADMEDDLQNDRLHSAANRLYYGVFNAMRVLLAKDNENFSKHKGVISYFRGVPAAVYLNSIMESAIHLFLAMLVV